MNVNVMPPIQWTWKSVSNIAQMIEPPTSELQTHRNKWLPSQQLMRLTAYVEIPLEILRHVPPTDSFRWSRAEDKKAYRSPDGLCSKFICSKSKSNIKQGKIIHVGSCWRPRITQQKDISAKCPAITRFIQWDIIKGNNVDKIKR